MSSVMSTPEVPRPTPGVLLLAALFVGAGILHFVKPQPFDRITLHRRNPAHNPSPAQMRALFEDAGFTVADQHRVRRPNWTQMVSDMITVGRTPDE